MRDTNDNMKIDKKKSMDKVNSPVALTIGLGTYVTQNPDDELVTVENLGILSKEDISDNNITDEEIIGVKDLW